MIANLNADQAAAFARLASVHAGRSARIMGASHDAEFAHLPGSFRIVTFGRGTDAVSYILDLDGRAAFATTRDGMRYMRDVATRLVVEGRSCKGDVIADVAAWEC